MPKTQAYRGPHLEIDIAVSELLGWPQGTDGPSIDLPPGFLDDVIPHLMKEGDIVRGGVVILSSLGGGQGAYQIKREQLPPTTWTEPPADIIRFSIVVKVPDSESPSGTRQIDVEAVRFFSSSASYLRGMTAEVMRNGIIKLRRELA